MGCDTSKDNATTTTLTDDMILGLNVASSSKQYWPTVQSPISIIQEYIETDIKCGKLEATCPGPRLATCEAWLEFLNIQHDNLVKQQRNYYNNLEQSTNSSSNDASSSATATLTRNDTFSNNNNKYKNSNNSSNNNKTLDMEKRLPIVSLDRRKNMQNQTAQRQQQQQQPSPKNQKQEITPMLPPFQNHFQMNANTVKTKTPTQDFIKMALNLGVLNDLNKASEYEEYFAQLSEKSLHSITERCYTEIIEHTEIRLKTLREKYIALTTLYKKLDQILVLLNNGTYLSRFEENLDKQLKMERDVRDKLGSTLEQWHICGLLLKTSNQLASQSLKQWRKIKTTINPCVKLETTLFSRKDLQASLLCLECAQAALPNVAIKYISNRQISTVKHCIIYVITDIINLKRYEHCTNVFTNYELNSSKAVVWFYDTFNKTLREDFLRANDNVFNLMKTLRDYREEIYITQQQQQ